MTPAFHITSYGLASFITETPPITAALSSSLTLLVDKVYEYVYPKEHYTNFIKELGNAIGPCLLIPSLGLFNSLALFAVSSDIKASLQAIAENQIGRAHV